MRGGPGASLSRVNTHRSTPMWIAIVSLVLAACSARSGPEGRTTETADRQPASAAPVLLVSIDGFRPDYLERGLTPHLDELAERGVRAEALIPSFPTKTFPNHYTMVTGLRPDRHGLVANNMWDPD